MSGYIFYEGPSRIDGKPIIGIATLNTENSKTGNVVQTWILRQDVTPLDAINSGEDKSICGDCPLRGTINKTNKGRGCYVAVHTAPRAIYTKYKNGGYQKLTEENGIALQGLGLRYGSYGDPVAIPIRAWKNLLKYCTGKSYPGYTHQWKKRRFSNWSKKLMASTHSVAHNELAHSMGWRTFRTILAENEKSHNEIICPASAERNFSKTCETCGACDGRKNPADIRKSIAIVVHGRPSVQFPARKLISLKVL